MSKTQRECLRISGSKPFIYNFRALKNCPISIQIVTENRLWRKGEGRRAKDEGRRNMANGLWSVNQIQWNFLTVPISMY